MNRQAQFYWSALSLQGCFRLMVRRVLPDQCIVTKPRALAFAMMLTALTMSGALQSDEGVSDENAGSWWRTPAQQAHSAFEAGDAERLRRVAPSTHWQGVAEHLAGEYSAAIERFDQAAQEQQLAGREATALRSLYNRGVSEVRAGEYQTALETFDSVLAEDPEHADARHNRDIAERLLALQQPQEPQSSQDQNQQSSSESEGSNASGDNESASGDGQGSPDSSQGGNESQASESTQDGAQGSESSQQQQQAERDARDALQAEAEQSRTEWSRTEWSRTEASQNEGPEAEQALDNAAAIEEPLSESEQATEQWLRRIPDDPAGLLRRKLEQNHRNEYPEVRDADNPW